MGHCAHQSSTDHNGLVEVHPTIIAAKLFWNQPLVFDAAAQVKVNQGYHFNKFGSARVPNTVYQGLSVPEMKNLKSFLPYMSMTIILDPP